MAEEKKAITEKVEKVDPEKSKKRKRRFGKGL
jgi:hypothetical protein